MEKKNLVGGGTDSNGGRGGGGGERVFQSFFSTVSNYWRAGSKNLKFRDML